MNSPSPIVQDTNSRLSDELTSLATGYNTEPLINNETNDNDGGIDGSIQEYIRF